MNTRSLGPTGRPAGGPVKTIDPAQVRRNRIVLCLLLLSFVLPFVVGHLAYFDGWFKGTPTTNKGELLSPPAAFADLHLQGLDGKPLSAAFLDHHWWLLYVLPAQCDTACHNRLYQMRQVRRANGQEADRVKLVLVQPQQPDIATVGLLSQQFPDIVRVNGSAPAINQALAAATASAAGAGRLYIMDPMGYIMLSYAPEADEKTSIVKAQDVLDDLKNLLKASQIG